MFYLSGTVPLFLECNRGFYVSRDFPKGKIGGWLRGVKHASQAETRIPLSVYCPSAEFPDKIV